MKRNIRTLSLFAGAVSYILSFGVAVAASPDLIEAAKKEGEVVIWTNSFEEPDILFKDFKEKFPFIKIKIWDGRTSEIINKTISEAKVGRLTPDFLVVSSRALPHIHAAGLLRAYPWPDHVNQWPHQPKHDFWRLHAVSVRMPVYNSNRVSPADAPKSWDDIKDPKWKGNAIISSSGSDAPLLFAHLWRKEDGELNWDGSFDFWQEVIKTTRPKVVRGFSGPLGSISSGEYKIFLLSSSNGTLRLMERGAPLKMARVGKTVASTWGVGVLKNAPHPNATRLLVDYFLSPDVLIRYAELNGTPLIGPEFADTAKPNIILKKSGIEWYPIPVEVRDEENARLAARWWTNALGLRRGGRGKKKKK